MKVIRKTDKKIVDVPNCTWCPNTKNHIGMGHCEDWCTCDYTGKIVHEDEMDKEYNFLVSCPFLKKDGLVTELDNLVAERNELNKKIRILRKEIKK